MLVPRPKLAAGFVIRRSLERGGGLVYAQPAEGMGMAATLKAERGRKEMGLQNLKKVKKGKVAWV